MGKCFIPRKFTLADHELVKREPGMVMNINRNKSLRVGYTLVFTFSRDWCVHNFFATLNHMKIDMKHCNLLVIDNSNFPTLSDHLAEKLDCYRDAFRTIRLYKTWRMGGGENVMEDDRGYHHSKLPYIFAMQKDMSQLIKTNKFVLLEDDTLAPPNAVMRLLSLLEDNPDCGIATGLETGRSLVAWSKTRIGVHYVHRPGNRLLWRLSPSPRLRGIHKVDACGWYCLASYKKVWEKGFAGMDEYVDELPRFALDGIHTNNIKKAGYDILADFDLWCKHMQPMGDQLYFWERKRARPMLDVWLPEWKIYAQQILLDKPWHKKMLKDLVKQRESCKTK